MSREIEKEIKFKNIYNFRDIGDLITEDGRKIKAGLLFRSDDLSRLSKRDLDTIQGIGLKVICDLRTVNERKANNYQLPESTGTKIIHIPIYHGSQDLSHREFFRLLVGNSKKVNFENMIYEFYLCIVSERQAEIKKILNAIVNINRAPALIHCTGGKDRTGLITALIQLYLGVSYDTVIEHYLKSNALIEPRMIKVERFIRLMSLYRISSERIKPLLIVKRAYLDTALQKIFSEYESIESYFIEGCEVDERTLINLKEMMIES